MKKIALLMALCCLILGLCLPVLAKKREELIPMLPPLEPEIVVDNYNEYKSVLKKYTTPDSFVPYERICFLGEFVSFKAYSLSAESNGAYYYDLIASDGVKINLAFSEAKDRGFRWSAGILSIASNGDRTQVDVETILEENWMYETDYIDRLKGFYIEDWEDNTYYYDREGALECIKLYFAEGESCVIRADFSQCRPDSYVGRLVYGTNEDIGKASTEIKQRMRDSYYKSWEQPLTICLSAIGGAIVATLITLLAVRKKRGTPAPIPAMAGVPVGEVSAGSDGNVSAAPAGAAPAAPESSTPPKAAATDTPTPEETPPPRN